jgi:hypothetical protein
MLNRNYYEILTNLERNAPSADAKRFIARYLTPYTDVDNPDAAVLVPRVNAVAGVPALGEVAEVPPVDAIPGLSGIPAISMSVMLIHRLALNDDYRDYFFGLEPQQRAIGTPQMSCLDQLIPKDPRFKCRPWTSIKFDPIAYWFVGGFRSSFIHTDIFQGTTLPFYCRDAEGEYPVYLGTEGGKNTGNVNLRSKRTANPAHIAGAGTDPEQQAARVAGLSDFRHEFARDITVFMEYYDEFVQGMEEHFDLSTNTLDTSSGGLPFWQIRYHEINDEPVCGGWLPPSHVSTSIAEIGSAFRDLTDWIPVLSSNARLTATARRGNGTNDRVGNNGVNADPSSTRIQTNFAYYNIHTDSWKQFFYGIKPFPASSWNPRSRKDHQAQIMEKLRLDREEADKAASESAKQMKTLESEIDKLKAELSTK